MRAIGLVLAVMAAACGTAQPQPAEIRLGEDACAQCRMTIVSPATAAQITAAGEEPIMFDELGCLRAYLRAHPLDAGAVVFVADHRTGAWIDARLAVFTRTAVPTPMGSGVIAHADEASRDADPAATHRADLDRAWLLQPGKDGDTP